ncbi:tyrosine/nicotianamine aminotransferase [Chloropicon primus]|uniref:Tyrosine/nicotianamine aminotransferase n=2 Tax=Chloropicon primus TaxID=1764295 RepID=A0A5B8MWM6_9CHLO|nr:tyrosine/nicotianamine aminotransferase [Chloropicon primus]UPR03784.1 tyrosine/nicotianamine aminotransferase [Chloropicon primus]|eukprot:QDZ24576.1 tyrosine/nicotianamine aminotransferase [Chloropicon primus]
MTQMPSQQETSVDQNSTTNNNTTNNTTTNNTKKMNLVLGSMAARPKNRIRVFVERILRNAPKEGEVNEKTGVPYPKRMDLSLGDPTALGLSPPQEAKDAVVEAIQGEALTTKQVHGYQHSCGSPAFREAITREIRPALGENAVFVTSGCSQALQFALTALAKDGSNVLVPNPAFPLYNTICEFVNAEARPYKLLSDRGWQSCLEDLEAKCDQDTCCLLVCNPGNPTSHSYSPDHIEELLRFAYRRGIPVVADEVYAHMTYQVQVGGAGSSADEENGGAGDGDFQYMAEIAHSRLGSQRPPVLSCSALSKRFLVPGWRTGWLALYDDAGESLEKAGLYTGIAALCQIGMTPTSLIQAAAPVVLEKTPESYHRKLNLTMKKGAEYCLERCNRCPGLQCLSVPKGAMYLFFQVPTSNKEVADAMDSDDVKWCRELLEQQNVFTLPGVLFGSPGFVRIVSAAPMSVLEEAWNRIEDFCKGN